MSIYQGVPSFLQANKIAESQRRMAFGKEVREESYSVAPSQGIMTVYFKTSSLVNVSGTDLSGRKSLTIENLGDTDIIYGASNCISISDSSDSGYIIENGKRLEGGGKVTINFTGDSVPIYARSTGFSVDIKVEER